MSQTSRYTKRLYLFIGLIVLLIGISQTSIHLYLTNHDEDYTKVKLAGRQRSFIQELVKNSLILDGLQDPQEVADLKEKIGIILQKWKNTHRALEYGDKAYGVSGESDEKINALFDNIYPFYSEINEKVQLLIEENSLSESSMEDLLVAEKNYEKEISQLIFHYSQQADTGAATFRVLELGLALLILGGLFFGYHLIIKPVTRKLELQTQELTQLNRELADAGKIKSRFLANLSHEIQTPIQGILGLIEILKKQKSTPQAQATLSTLEDSAGKLSTMVNGLLDYSLLESGLMKLNPEAFDPRKAIDEVCSAFRARVQEKGLELSVNVSPDIPSVLIMDQGRFKQVLLNLVANAVKFTERGEIEVNARLVNTEESFAQISLSVRDTGIGLDDETRKVIFESFTQAQLEDDRAYEGLGMGLTICRDLVKLMNGKLHVESLEGKGSEFTFNVIAEVATGSETIYENIGSLDGKKAIVVDDNKTNLKVLVRMLATWGMRVTPFNSPDLVRDTIDSISKFDFVILDLQMPGMDGRQLARNIRSKFPKEQVKIIVLSTSADDVIVDGEELFDAVVQKPIKNEVLLRSLLRLVQEESNKSSSGRSGIQLPGNYRKLSVLVAEGNPLHQAVAEKTLKRMGLQIDTARSQRELFSKLQTDTFDLIIIDEELEADDPNVEAVRRIRELFDNEEDIPVVFSVSPQSSPKDRGVKNADDYIASVNVETMSDKVMHWFSEDE